MYAAALAALFALAPQDPPSRQQAPPRLVLRGATVHTGTGAPWTGDLQAERSRIAAPAAAPADAGLVVELPGAFVTPGLHDAHGHLSNLGATLRQVDLVGTRSFAEVVDRTAAAAAKLPKGSWVIGRGWDQNDWSEPQLPHHAELSAAVPDHPVWLVRVDGHAGLLNLRGLRAAGVTRDSEAPAGGEILRDEQGEPTGVLVDRAMGAVPTPDAEPQELRERLLLAQAECLRLGLTCVHDAGVSRAELEQLRLLHAAGQWRLRTYVLLAANERELIQKGPWQSADGLLVVRAVKGYADGALGSYGAALLAPYADAKQKKGLLLTPRAGLLDLAQRCADAGMQLCTHAIGDAANRTVLDAYAAVKVEGGLAVRRFRIEHAQIVHPDDVARFRTLGVLPSMQPTHLTSDMPWAPVRLGPERVPHAYNWQAFLALGLPVPFGSDFPVEAVDPRLGLHAAVTTRGKNGPPEGLRPEQRLSRAAALQGFTAHAAYARFAEQELGTIEPGKLADFTVWDRDLLRCSDDELLQAKVLLTVVGGRIVHDGRGQ